MAGEPTARLAVQSRKLVRKAVPQLRAEHLREERVIPEPSAARVERFDEALGSLQLAKRMLSRRRPRERLGQLAVQPVDDRRMEQEAERLLVVARDDLRHQVVAHGPVIAGEALDESLRVGMGLERELGKPEPSGPPLGALPERLDAVGGKLVRREELARLRAGEGQLGRSNLLQPAGDPEALEAERRIAARRDDEPEPVPRVLDEPLEVRGHPAAAHRVEVVQDQAYRIVELRERVAESRERAGTASGHREARELRACPCQRGEDLEPERPPVGVLGGERDVRDRLSVLRRGHPPAQQHGLAGAGGGRDERERAFDTLLDEAQQPRTLYQRRRPRGMSKSRRRESLRR